MKFAMHEGVYIHALGIFVVMRDDCLQSRRELDCSAGEDGQALVWIVVSGELEQKLAASNAAFNVLVFDAKNKNLLSAANDDYCFVRWNVANGTGR